MNILLIASFSDLLQPHLVDIVTTDYASLKEVTPACIKKYLADVVTSARESPQNHHILCSDLLTAVLRVVSCKVYDLGSDCLCN